MPNVKGNLPRTEEARSPEVTRLLKLRETLLAQQILRHPSDPENKNYLMRPGWGIPEEDLQAYAGALWSPESPAYPLDTWRLPNYFESFWAMRPYLTNLKGRLRAPMPLVRAKTALLERRRALVTFGELILQDCKVLQDLAKSRGVSIGWRGR